MGYRSPETIQKCFRKCGFGSEEVGGEEINELPHPDHETLQLMDDTEWADFVQFDRNVETTETLDDKVICSEQDDDDDDDVCHYLLYMSAKIISKQLGLLLWHRIIQNF